MRKAQSVQSQAPPTAESILIKKLAELSIFGPSDANEQRLLNLVEGIGKHYSDKASAQHDTKERRDLKSKLLMASGEINADGTAEPKTAPMTPAQRLELYMRAATNYVIASKINEAIGLIELSRLQSKSAVENLQLIWPNENICDQKRIRLERMLRPMVPKLILKRLRSTRDEGLLRPSPAEPETEIYEEG